MANASARHSFHGPVTTTARPRAKKPHRPAEPVASRPLELVPAPPSKSSIGRAALQAARAESPPTSERERILAGVLAALQRLTSA